MSVPQPAIGFPASLTCLTGRSLEAILLHSKIEECVDRGEKIYALHTRIQAICERNKELHLQFLAEIFREAYGVVDTVVTSQDLLDAGFDDSAEPQLIDYIDLV